MEKDCAWNGIDATTSPDDKPYDISYRYQSVSVCPGARIPLLLLFELLANYGKDPLVSSKGSRKYSVVLTTFRVVLRLAKAHVMTMSALSMFLHVVRLPQLSQPSTDIELVLDSAGATGSSCGGAASAGE